MRTVSAGAVFTACVLLLLLAACDAAVTPPPPAPPQVVVATPTQRDVTIVHYFTGNTRAVESVEIRARVAGLLEEVGFEEGSQVEEGELLFKIEREQYATALAQAEAEIEGANAFLDRTESDLARLEEAIKTNAVSQQEVARATAERDQAKAGLAGATARRDKARLDLEYTEIHAPTTGIISRWLVDPGNLVGSREPTLLATVFNVDPVHVYFDVNEQTIASALERFGGMAGIQSAELDELTVSVTVEGVADSFAGLVDYIDPAADPDTGTVLVRAVVPNPEGRLLPGFFVRIRTPGAELPGALLVPETSIGTDLGGRFVMLVGDDGLVERRYITPGQLEDDNLRVVLEGLEPGESFIVEGLQRARPGMPVSVKGN